jgi:hypothetical protein
VRSTSHHSGHNKRKLKAKQFRDLVYDQCLDRKEELAGVNIQCLAEMTLCLSKPQLRRGRNETSGGRRTMGLPLRGTAGFSLNNHYLEPRIKTHIGELAVHIIQDAPVLKIQCLTLICPHNVVTTSPTFQLHQWTGLPLMILITVVHFSPNPLLL